MNPTVKTALVALVVVVVYGQAKKMWPSLP